MTDTSAPAFPSSSVTHDIPGMTLRDWFAGQVLNGVISSIKDHDVWIEEHAAYLAKASYQIADAMLAERSKR